MPWIAGGLITDPIANQILADTGSLSSGQYTVVLLLTSNPPGIEVIFQQTNSAGTVVQLSKIIPVTLALLPVQIPDKSLLLQAGERLRVVNRIGVTGYDVQASIFYSVVSYP